MHPATGDRACFSALYDDRLKEIRDVGRSGCAITQPRTAARAKSHLDIVADDLDWD